MDDSLLRPIAGAIHDDMMLLAARGASRIVAAFDEAGGTLRCRKVDFEEIPGGLKPELGTDPYSRAHDLSAAATELRAFFQRSGVAWSGASVELIQLERARVALRFIEAGRATQTIEFGPDDPHAIITNRFFDDVDRANRALASSSAALFAGAGGIRSFHLDQDRAVLALETAAGRRDFPLQFLASWSAESATLLWAWENPSFDARCTSLAIAARNEKRREGIGRYARPQVWCEAGLAQALVRTLVASHAQAVFPAQHDHGIFFLALA